MSLAACLMAVLVGLAVAWAQPRPMSDYYLALAGGRDVLDGKLGQPDDWSFLTEGRVWIHQNWGADAIFYTAHRGLGDPGILALKALLLILAAAAALAAARTRGANWTPALLVCALGLASWPEAAVIRASLFSFLLAPMLLLVFYRSVTRPRWIWAVPPLLALWANLHGSFMLGLGMAWTWAGCVLLAEAGTRGLTRALRHRWPAGAAAALATALAGTVTPFGLRNLTTPFTVGPHSGWNQVHEWQPIFGGRDPSLNPWPFVAFAALLLVFGIAGLRSAGKRRSPETMALAAFETILTLALLYLAFRSRRFALLAAISLTPVLARRIQGTLRDPILLALGMILVLLGLVQGEKITAHYAAPADPRNGEESFLDKMVGKHVAFPVGAATFLAGNEVRGRMFQEYRWESYLHWTCPDLQLFVGGRAQQIYTEADRAQNHQLMASPTPGSVLRDWGVGLVAVPLLPEFAPFVSALLQGANPGWVYVYTDHLALILADPTTPGGAALVKQAGRGELRYPDRETALLSQGMCLGSPGMNASPGETYRVLREALELRPVYFAYGLLATRAVAAGIPSEELASFLVGQQARIQEMLAANPSREDLRQCLQTLDRMVRRR